MGVSAVIYFGSALACAAWAIMVLVVRRAAGWLPALACLVAAAWSAAVGLQPEQPLDGVAGILEVARNLAFLALLLAMCWRLNGPRMQPVIGRLALAGVSLAGLSLLAQNIQGAPAELASPNLGSPALLVRIALALVLVAAAENLYRNASEAERWLVNLPCIGLGAIGAFNVVLYTSAALAHGFSPALLDARAPLNALAALLIAVGALRGRSKAGNPPISRAVAFHGATMVIGGTFLLGVGAAGEVLRRWAPDWGQSAQVSLLVGALVTIAVAISTGSVRSRLRRGLVDHFFSARYDYRREWLRCSEVLSAADSEASAPTRAIRAIADPMDSRGGVLLLRGAGEAGLSWAGSWNMPSLPLALPANHAILAMLGDGIWQAEPVDSMIAGELLAAYGPLWLGVPLLHQREGLLGVVLLGPPRAPFSLDREVFDLLRTLGREVAMFLAERQAAERLVDQRRVQDYAKRFAFVAHDVKTVSSQLSLVLANAEDNIDDPEFQRDMLTTVRASTQRINALIQRLGQPGEEPASAGNAAAAGSMTVAAGERLRALAAAHHHPVGVEMADIMDRVAMRPEDFDTAIGHLLNNAAEASAPDAPVQLVVRAEHGRILIDMTDRGAGMTAEFIRDSLFRPLSTTKAQGSGIGTWQARELLRDAGGELTVLSQPGAGTTMRITLPAAPQGSAA